MTNMRAGKEKRSKPRISNQFLPQSLKHFTVTFENGMVLPAETIDASESGIAFRLEVPVYNISDYNVTLVPSDKSFKLQEEIVYIKPLSSETSRVSIQFTRNSNLESYLTKLGQGTRND